MFRATQLEIARPAQTSEVDDVVVLRTWLIASERWGAAAGSRPILTGVFGFPWRSPLLEAKCTIRDPDRGSFGPGTSMVDRHHPIVPAPWCTCGIYASTDLLSTPAAGLLPPATPIAVGFVELSGARVQRESVIRAQSARIVGPLTIAPGRPPWTTRVARRLGRDPRPTRVVEDGERHRVLWHRAALGRSYEDWLAATADHLADRYGVPVGPHGTAGPT